MELPDILKNPHFKVATIVAGIFTVLYFLANVFVVGGDEFIIKFNDATAVPLAILTTLCAYLIWKQVKNSPHSRALWGGLFVGWGLWALAELSWAIYTYLDLEIPYPSIADFFWLAGYLPIGYGLYVRLKEMPIRLNRAQKISLLVFTLGIVAITFTFVLLPVIESNDFSRLAEAVLNLLYPLADQALFIIGICLLLVYRSGDYGFGWNLISAGFLLTTLSDLLYSYLSTNGLYYPDGTANLISSLGVSVPYNLSYLLWVLGIYAVSLILRGQRPFEQEVQPQLVSNTHVLVFTKSDETVTSVSNNFGLVFGDVDIHAKNLASILKIPQPEAQAILAQIRDHRTVADWPLLLETDVGGLQPAFVSGIEILSPQGEYSGAILALRLLLEADSSLDENLNDYQKSIVVQVRKMSGSSEEAEIRQLLLDYYSSYLKQFYNLVFHTSGPQLSLVFLERLRETAKQNQWPLQFNPQTLLTQADYPVSILQASLPVLLETARRFTVQLTDESEIRAISAQFSETIHANVAYCCTQRLTVLPDIRVR